MWRQSVFGVGFLVVFGTTYSALRQNAILLRLWINHISGVMILKKEHNLGNQNLQKVNRAISSFFLPRL